MCCLFKCDPPASVTGFVFQFDLVCGKSGWIEVSQSLYMTGFLISTLAFGAISDRSVFKMRLTGALWTTDVIPKLCGQGELKTDLMKLDENETLNTQENKYIVTIQ